MWLVPSICSVRFFPGSLILPLPGSYLSSQRPWTARGSVWAEGAVMCEMMLRRHTQQESRLTKTQRAATQCLQICLCAVSGFRGQEITNDWSFLWKLPKRKRTVQPLTSVKKINILLLNTILLVCTKRMKPAALHTILFPLCFDFFWSI